MPEKMSSYMSATRRGVPMSPARSGSSPMPSRMRRTPCSILLRSTSVWPERRETSGRLGVDRVDVRRLGHRRLRRTYFLLAVTGDLGAVLRGLLVALEEGLFFGLAVDQRLELGGLDGLAHHEDLADRVEQLTLVVEQVLGALVGLLDDAADLVVDLASHFVRVVGLLLKLAPQEGHGLVVAQGARAEFLAHAEAHDHLLGGGRGLLEVVGGARGDLAEDDLLGGAPAQRHGQGVHELTLGGQELVLDGQRDGVAQRLAAAHDRDLVHGVGVLEEVADERVAHLVIRRDGLLFLGDDARLLLGPGEAALLSARYGKKVIGMHELEEGIMRVLAGPEKKTRIISEKEKASRRITRWATRSSATSSS